MAPDRGSTACWRGYACSYEIRDGTLLLDSLMTNLAEGEEPVINGNRPSIYRSWSSMYEGLSLPVRFSGELLLGRDFIEEMYVHMGFQKPTSFREVKEITLREGGVTILRDHSERMQEFRERAAESASGGVTGGMSRDEIGDFVTYAFDLDYRSWTWLWDSEDKLRYVRLE
jgi:hypothetical protein